MSETPPCVEFSDRMIAGRRGGLPWSTIWGRFHDDSNEAGALRPNLRASGEIEKGLGEEGVELCSYTNNTFSDGNFVVPYLEMEIEFDPAKDAANQAKHGISLAAAAHMDLGRAVIEEDTKRDYGETRYLALAPLGGALHVLCYTWRGGILRVIGLRKANDRERKRYDRPT